MSTTWEIFDHGALILDADRGCTAYRTMRLSRFRWFDLPQLPERGDRHPAFASMECVDREVIDKLNRLVRFTYFWHDRAG